MRLFSLLLALFLFCRSSLLPIVIEFCSFLYAKAVSVFRNSIYVFIIANTIAMFICILTLQDGNAASTCDRAKSEPESISHVISDSGGETTEQSDKQIVLTEFPPEKQGGLFSDKFLKGGLTVETETPKVELAEFTDVRKKFAETKMTTHRTLTSKVGGENVTEVKRSHKRVESEIYERRVIVKHGRNTENRRSQTQGQPAMYSSGPTAETQRRLRRMQALQAMSDEEFNRTLEDFIAKHKGRA